MPRVARKTPAPQVHEEAIDLVGEVRSADVDARTFTMVLNDGRRVSGVFRSSQASLITEALRGQGKAPVRIKGRAEFTTGRRRLRRIVRVDGVELLLSAPAPDAGEARRPIWEIAAEIGASVPDSEWQKVPTDLAENLDHYLYGAPKVGE